MTSEDPLKDVREYWDELVSLGLIHEKTPENFGSLFLLRSGWGVLDVGEDGQQKLVYVHQALARALALDRVSSLVQFGQLMKNHLKKFIRRSVRRTLLLRTLFLPITLAGARPFPTRPGSVYTQGMALVGFLATLCIPGVIAAVLTNQWEIAGMCAYWWLGAHVLRNEYRSQGLNV